MGCEQENDRQGLSPTECLKEIMERLWKNEEGQAFPLALIALVVGALLVGAFLSYTGTNLIASRIFSRLMAGQYAADAGVEDAIWNLAYGGMAAQLPAQGDARILSQRSPLNEGSLPMWNPSPHHKG